MIFYFVTTGAKIEEMNVFKEAKKQNKPNIGILLSYMYIKNETNSEGNKRFQELKELRIKEEEINED